MHIERWREDYNRVRQHSSFGYRRPAPEAIALGRPERSEGGPAAGKQASGTILIRTTHMGGSMSGVEKVRLDTERNLLSLAGEPGGGQDPFTL